MTRLLRVVLRVDIRLTMFSVVISAVCGVRVGAVRVSGGRVGVGSGRVAVGGVRVACGRVGVGSGGVRVG